MGLTAKQWEYIDHTVQSDRNPHLCAHRWNIKSGAVRSGKTYVDTAYVIAKRILHSSERGHIVLLGNTQETVRRNILEPMRAIWGGNIGRMNAATGEIRLFGRSAVVLGADTRDRVKALQGMSVAYCYGDEITTWNEDVFSMLKSRLDLEESTFDGTCNPAGPNHWFKRFLDSGADIYLQTYTLEDNPCLPPAFVRQLKAEYAGSVLYDRYVLGKWASADGIVYRAFDPVRHVVEEAAVIGRISFAVDVGHINATCFLAIGEAGDGRAYVLDEYYHSGAADGKARSPLGYARDFERFARTLRARYPQARYEGTYVDPSAAGFMAQLRECGVTRVYRARNAVVEGIAAVASLMDSDRLRVLACCRSLLHELASYAWDPHAAARGEDAPIKRDDHAVDALRYWVSTHRRRNP